MPYKFIGAGLIWLLLVGWVLSAAVSADNESAFTLRLSTETPRAGSEFQVTITGTQLNDLYAYEVNLTYDSSRLQFIRATSAVPGYAVEPFSQGDAIRLAFTKVGSNPGLSGDEPLYTLTFRSIGTGAADIRIDSLMLVDSQLASVSIAGNAQVVAVIDGGPTESPAEGPADGPTEGPTPGSTAGPGPAVIRPPINADDFTGMATSSIPSAAWEQTLREAKANTEGRAKILIQMEEVPEATAYRLELPATAYSEGDEQPSQIEITTSLATLIVSGNMMGDAELPSGNIALRVGLADTNRLDDHLKTRIGNRPVIELSMHAGDQTIAWNNPNAPVTVRIPYTPTVEELQNPEHIVVWYIDGEGQVVPVPSGQYDPVAGLVSFTTTHFSAYAVSYVVKTFDDADWIGWAKRAIEVLAAKGIVYGTSERTFNPAAPITRADFLALLVRTLELQGTPGGRFADVPEAAYYDDALRIARGHGIVEGIGNNRFDPLASISRQDMITLTARALRVINRSAGETDAAGLSRFADAASISAYAADSVAMLAKLGLVQGDGNAIHPRSATSRAESAVLMYNVYRYLYP